MLRKVQSIGICIGQTEATMTDKALPVSSRLPRKIDGKTETLGPGVVLNMPQFFGKDEPFHFGWFTVEPGTLFGVIRRPAPDTMYQISLTL